VSDLFKGIALFTPGGDLIYCIDSSKHDRWHSHLCSSLRELFEISEPPHFLVPGYTATVDQYLDYNTNQIETIAEVYPPVQRHCALLEKVFGVQELDWHLAPWQEEFCNPIILETYRDRFAPLWENRDLIVRLDAHNRQTLPSHWQQDFSNNHARNIAQTYESASSNGYVLRLFVSGDSLAIVKTLETIHQLLEKDLGHPYTLKLIDISKNPEQAEINRISATPALVRVWPQPVRRIVGDLSDLKKILQILTSF
jgi:circadian clock protein KaiB